MKLPVTLLFDDDTRKQVREWVFGEARNVSRSEIDKTVRDEIARLGQNLMQRLETSGWRFEQTVKSALTELLTNKWTDIARHIDQYVEAAADRVVAEKLKNKTVWEAREQETYVRKIAAQEATKIVALNLGKE